MAVNGLRLFNTLDLGNIPTVLGLPAGEFPYTGYTFLTLVCIFYRRGQRSHKGGVTQIRQIGMGIRRTGALRGAPEGVRGDHIVDPVACCLEDIGAVYFQIRVAEQRTGHLIVRPGIQGCAAAVVLLLNRCDAASVVSKPGRAGICIVAAGEFLREVEEIGDPADGKRTIGALPQPVSRLGVTLGTIPTEEFPLAGHLHAVDQLVVDLRLYSIQRVSLIVGHQLIGTCPGVDGCGIFGRIRNILVFSVLFQVVVGHTVPLNGFHSDLV